MLAEEGALSAASAALAELDHYAGLAELAVEENYVRPKIDESFVFAVEEGRHPMVEQTLRRISGAAFVGNDCRLGTSDDADTRILLVTGPNMAGKSTFLRQNALIVVLAQAGSFVPAKAAHIGIVDRLFSRVGRVRRPRQGPLDLHGRDGRDRRDPQSGERTVLCRAR